MARTKIKRRSYNLGNSHQTENGPREAERALTEEPVPDTAPKLSDATESDQEELPSAFLDSSTAKGQGRTRTISPRPQANAFSESHGNVLNMSPKPQEHGSYMSSRPQENGLDINDDCLELKSPVLGCSQRNVSVSRALVRRNDTVSPILGCSQGNISSRDQLSSSNLTDIDTHISRDSPLNLIRDSSMKENSPNFRPVTPDPIRIAVEEIFSPSTQKEIRSAIRALFPNGPPPPSSVRPMRRPKKGDKLHIEGCSKRPRVPSPKSLTVFLGDKYGITNNTNYLEDEEQCPPAKRARRGPKGIAKLSKSRFDPQSNERAERLKMYEKIDRLLGRTPKDQPVSYMSNRSFSPLPSTSTDNETIMKNDKHFNESFNCDNYDIDDDEELPEILWHTSSCKQEKDSKDLTLVIDKDLKEYKKSNTDNISIDINEYINNNNSNDIITVNDDFCEIDFDKYMPKEKILDYSDVEVVKPKQESEVIANSDLKKDVGLNSVPPSVLCPTTSMDVICVEDVWNQGTITNQNENRVSQASTNPATSVLRASNKIVSTASKQSDLFIEVPDVLEPINMICQASTSRLPTWHEDVQFVSEVRTNETPRDENIKNISDVQITSQASSSQSRSLLSDLSWQFLLDLSESDARRKSRKKSKRQKSRENPGTPVVNNENAAPSVNQAQPDNSTSQPVATSPGTAKRIGECPICLESLLRASIASTNCGHVFCLDCIKQSLKTTGKKCPTCRKQLRGVGYHQVFFVLLNVFMEHLPQVGKHSND